MTIEIRNVRTDEYADYVRAIGTGFLDRPDGDLVAEQVSTLWEPGRTWAAFDGDLICGTFRSWATELTRPRRPGAAGVRGGRGHGAAHPSAAGHPDPTRRGRARGDPGSRRGGRAPVRLRVPDLRPVRLRAGLQGRDLDAAGRAHRVPRRSRVVRRAHGARRGRRRDDPIGVRGVATPAAGRDPAPRLPLGGRPRAPGQPVGPAVEGVPRGPSRRRRQSPTAMPATGARSSSSIASPRARSPSTSCTR